MKRYLFTPTEALSIENPIFTPYQLNIICKRTPESEIENKIDENGNPYKSVKVGYVKKQMALIFGFNYDFEIKSREYFPSTKEVLVEGRLIIRTGLGVVIREQFGGFRLNSVQTGANIGSNQAIDIVDGYKAAASNAFRKCAFEIGICWDIQNQDRPETKQDEKPVKTYADEKVLQRYVDFMCKCNDLAEMENIFAEFEKSTKIEPIHIYIQKANYDRIRIAQGI